MCFRHLPYDPVLVVFDEFPGGPAADSVTQVEVPLGAALNHVVVHDSIGFRLLGHHPDASSFDLVLEGLLRGLDVEDGRVFLAPHLQVEEVQEPVMYARRKNLSPGSTYHHVRISLSQYLDVARNEAYKHPVARTDWVSKVAAYELKSCGGAGLCKVRVPEVAASVDGQTDLRVGREQGVRPVGKVTGVAKGCAVDDVARGYEESYPAVIQRCTVRNVLGCGLVRNAAKGDRSAKAGEWLVGLRCACAGSGEVRGCLVANACWRA